jgi:hypothetical protein
MNQAKRAIAGFLMVAAVLGSTTYAQEKSDFEVIQSFKKKHSEIQKAIETASTVQECVDVASRIDDLEKEFADDTKLLDKALYPDGYKGKITTVRVQLKLSQDKLGIIQTQYARITELETQVKTLTEKVDKMTSENADLLSQVQRMGETVKGTAAGARADKQTIDSLNAMIGKLRSNIKERDALIFALVDSLFMQYDKSVGSMKDVEKQGLAGKLERRNVFTNVRKSVEDNIAFLQSTALSSHDIAEMVKEQRRFQSQWKAFGSKLTGLYEPGKKGANQVAQIEGLVDEWGKKAETAFWKGLNLAFRDKGYGVKIFNTGGEFVANFKSFVDEEIQIAAKGNADQAYKRFQGFSDSLWSKELELAWLPLLVESGKITDAQKKEVEAKFAEWGNAVHPPRMWIYLIVGLVVLVIAYVLFKKMQSPKVPKP